ncbi:protein unc-80 homolog isoform X2 [Anopheles aquasalis]|uniref:protein unc-80 homolog isoform X2 n=1 Tax=Anopheles aquasalis TaxID=42839 RepID=UPI00215B72C9|nr:protein unc-80 homolog isoform X2 [Anopheles aquasalis]
MANPSSSTNPIDEGLQDLGVPVPVQTFLWQQIAPFIRPKLGKLHEASCMFCQHAPGHHELKEACKSFEKVLVQNIQFGLSPSLTSALESIPRWRIVQAALPHVIHCAGALMHNRVKDLQALGSAETKILYTLHWILLFASEECADAEHEKDATNNYLFSIPTISLFVFLFAPIAHMLKESDFQNFRLENGLKMWQGMWEYRAPNAPCFTAPVKPKARNLLTSVSTTPSPEVFSPKKNENIESPPSMSYSGNIKHDDELSFVSSPKDSVFPETIPEEASSVEEERVVIFRLPMDGAAPDPSYYTADASLLHHGAKINKQPHQAPGTSGIGMKPHPLHDSRHGDHRTEHTSFDFDKIDTYSKDSKPKTSSSTERESFDTDPKLSQGHKCDVVAATFLDVAVLRCLFISHWQEEGVYWSLHYLYNRLRDISEESSVLPSHPRRRSNSLPIPQIEISMYQGPTSSRDSPSIGSVNKDYIEIPDGPINSMLTDSVYYASKQPSDENSLGPLTERKGSEKKRRVKMADLRTLIETRILSKSDRGLEKIGFDANSNGKRLQQMECHRSLDTGERQLSRSASMISRAPSTNLVKGKSMPSLRFHRNIEPPPPKVIRNVQSTAPSRQSSTTPKYPIITVTEHTPTPSPDYMKRQGSIDSQLDALSAGGSTGMFKSQMLRSHTDSHIGYTCVSDETEAPGSCFYITKEGTIDYEVVLLAVHCVFKRDSSVCTLRVLEAGLNICEILMDLGVLKLGDHAHSLTVGIVKRAFMHLGCPHGCNDANRGPPAEVLRTTCNSVLSRLLRQNGKLLKSNLRTFIKEATLHEVTDFFHAYLGFCVDPSSLLSPLNHKRSSGIKSLNPDFGGISGGQGGYATNFGSGLTGGTESPLIAAVFKTLATRLVRSLKELKSPDNLSLYSDVRQLITYVKGAHGGPFRVVALSGILSVTPRPHKQAPNMQTTRVIRHLPTNDIQLLQQDEKAQRKLLFKKKSTSSTCVIVPFLLQLLETEGFDEPYRASQSPLSNLRRKGPQVRPTLTPRHSERALLSDSTSSSERNSVGRLTGIVRWFRRSKDRDSSIDLESGIMGASGSDSMSNFMRKGSLNFQTRSRATEGIGRSIQKAKRRVERRLNRLGIGKGKKKAGGTEDTTGGYFSRRSSLDISDGPRESEVVVLKERRLIPTLPVREGMARLALLLEVCAPGSVPDPALVTALLDLPQAPIVARAAFLIECAHFVHLCNRGQWPSWMKQNLPVFRPSGPAMGTRSAMAAGTRRAHVLQRMAGKMFHQWGEALGARLNEMINTEKQNADQVTASLADPEKQKQLLQQDEEEDFLDETSVNPHGNDCPPALKLIACVLLLEITAFLRETYQTLPKASRLSTKEKQAPWDKVSRGETNRRWSMALSSMGHSQTSAQSLQSIAGQTERKISFVLQEPDNESENSSNTTLTIQGEENVPQGQKRTLATSRNFLLRRGTSATPAGGSFKRRSLKLRRGAKDLKEVENEYPVRRTDSIQSKRKVSSLSDRSDNSEPGQISGGEESPGILSDDQPPESPCDSNDSDETTKNLPWLKAVSNFMGSFHFYCDHQNFCHPYCYRRHMRAASKLIRAVRKIYGDEFGVTTTAYAQPNESAKGAPRRDRSKQGRKVSDQSSSQTSPSKRKDSVTKRDRIILQDESEPNTSQYSTFIHEPKQHQEDPPVLKYIKNQVREVFHAPIASLVKGAAVLTEEQFIEVIPVAWELLLETDQEVSAASAALFILASVKAPNTATEIMQRSLKNKCANTRIQAILRYQVLWKNRFQVWPRMEEGAHLSFKVPPPGIEFTLPSPKIGIESLPVVDPPWMPRQQNKDMEVTLNQERHRSLVTATKTRKKQQTEAIRHAMLQQEDKQRSERQSFLITTIPITQQAAHEPGLDHGPAEDHVEEEEDGTRSAIHMHAAHSLFPSCLCSSVMQIVACLDDAAVNSDGCAVYEVAYQVIWICLVEDSALFLRYVLERLTRDHQDQMFKLLRHLIRFVPRLPQQAAFALYNYIIGYVMFYVRSTHESSQQLVGSALSVLWMVVHSVHGIMFKDLKQILRKEQCDASILLTANVPSAKKIIVHGPEDEGGIPSQFPVQEDTQFSQLLNESLDFFGIDEKKHAQHVLVDYKTHQILNPNWYVRDLYFFKRSQYPQLRLVEMKPEESFNALQRQELNKKFVEIGKVHLTWAILKNVDMVVQRVVFLHEELMKLPSFPRKALEVDLDLHQGGELGKELLGLDVLHKFMWVRLIARMFEAMAGNFAYSADIQLFLNVLSGAALLHSEDSCIMRYVTATFINAASNFKNIFSTNGYFMIMPAMLQVYSLHQTNKLVTTTIEYAVKQFYLLNRKPFILQMFGSVSAILDTDENGTYGEAHKVQSSCLFNLLLSLETPSPDPLNIAELVKEPKPLKAIDFCYHDEDEMVTVLDCITLCVMVVSYSAESTRGYQMLIILEAILPCYMQQIQSSSYIPLEGKCERDIIMQLAVTIRTMVHNCEGLSKSYNGPFRSSPEHKGSSQRNCSRGPPCSPGLDYDDESHAKYVSDIGRTKMLNDSVDDSETIREYRRPRDVLLSVVGDFMIQASTRLAELARKQGEPKPTELLDVKCHVRLAEIAHSLLKVSPYDRESMACRGLQRYMQCIFPRAEWADDHGMKPTLVTILRRLDKVFLKISKKSSVRRNTNWEAAAGLLKGVSEAIIRYPHILHWREMKALLTNVQNLIVNEPGNFPEGVSGAGAALMSKSPPAFFCSNVVRLVALQVVSPVDSLSHGLEQICGGSADFPSQEKAENFLMHLLMPLCLKVCSGRGISDVGELKQSDISFLVTAVLNAMSPVAGRTGQSGMQTNRTGADLRAGSLTFTGSRDAKRPAKISSSLYQATFLALRVLCICFDTRLSHEWPRIARVMRDLGRRNEAAPELWSFLEFVVTQRTPLYIVLMPFILHKISQPPIGDHERHMQFLIRERMRGTQPTGGTKSRGAILLELSRELRELREELEARRYDRDMSTETSKRDIPNVPAAPEQPIRHQQRPSLISMLTGVQTPANLLSSLQQDARSGTGICTSSDTLSQQTLQAPKGESLSSSTTTTTNNREGGLLADSQSADLTLTSCTLADAGSSMDLQQQQQLQGTPGSQGPPTTGGGGIGGSIPHLSHSVSLQAQAAKVQPPRLRFVSSVEFKTSSGETSTTPLSPDSLADDSSGENHNKHRLQRSRAQSRKTFRNRRGMRSNNFNEPSYIATVAGGTVGTGIGSIVGGSPAPIASQAGLVGSAGAAGVSGVSGGVAGAMGPPTVNEPPASFEPINRTIATLGDLSWDSVSQTSSTSGYRDNYSLQTGLLSPDGSLSGNALGGRSSSQHSLLMLFETQDEDTLI